MSTKEIVRRVHKVGLGIIWLEKRECLSSKEIARAN